MKVSWDDDIPNMYGKISGWWFQPTPLKNMKKNPNIWKNKKKMFQTTNQ